MADETGDGPTPEEVDTTKELAETIKKIADGRKKSREELEKAVEAQIAYLDSLREIEDREDAIRLVLI